MILWIIGGVSIWLVTIIFGIFPLIYNKFRSSPKIISYSNCFAGGLFLAIGIIHILPEANESLSHHHHHHHDHDHDH